MRTSMRAAVMWLLCAACACACASVARASVCGGPCVCRALGALAERVDCSYAEPELLRRSFALPRVVYSLDLSRSDLLRLDASHFFESNTMRELVLSDNHLSRIDVNVFRLPELQKLDLSRNRLEYIAKEVFESLKKLERLNLANNRFTAFTQMTFRPLGILRGIVLDNNDIGPSLRDANLFDRSGFGLTRDIEELSIGGVNLGAVPDNFFSDVYDLKRLTISNNNLRDVFEIPFTLDYLDLSDNPIAEISSEDFANLPALKELRLNNLGIKEVPDYAFVDLVSLEKLELNRNRNLTVLSRLCFGREVLEDADDFTLEELSVSGCRLTQLDARLAAPLGRLTRLDLQGNPWRCDCDLLWIKSLQIAKRDYDHLRCGSPRPLLNARVLELGDASFVCATSRQHAALAAVGAALCACAGLAAAALWLACARPHCYPRGVPLGAPAAAYTVLPLAHTNDATSL